MNNTLAIPIVQTDLEKDYAELTKDFNKLIKMYKELSDHTLTVCSEYKTVSDNEKYLYNIVYYVMPFLVAVIIIMMI